MSRKLYILGLIILLLVSNGCRPEEEKKVPNPAHSSTFVTPEDFARCLSLKGEPVAVRGKISGAIVPHHLVAGHLIARTIEALAGGKPEVMILVGPNHHNHGAKVITGLYDWQTPEGIVKTDAQTVNELLQKKLAARDEEVLSGEHSVGALMPFVKHFLPETRVVPLIFHHDVSLEEVDAILQAIAPSLDSGAVLLGSVDFSHYLTRQEAQLKDEITLKVMQAYDYVSLYRMGNDHLDSPASLSMVLRDAERRGIREFQVLDHTNSGVILKNDLIETTSYFTIAISESESL